MITQSPTTFHSSDIIRLAGLLTQKIDAILMEKIDLTHAQANVLLAVEKDALMSQTEIALKLKLTTAAISRLVDILIEKNLLTRKINPRNRRQNLIASTELGQIRTTQAVTLLLEIEHQFFSEDDTTERLVFVWLERITQQLFSPDSV